MEYEVETVTKVEVASRQTTEAIRMFFAQRDLVATYTITYAAHQILTDLCKHAEIATIIKNNPLIRPDKSKEWRGIMSAAGNFFKHADRDPGAELTFRPKITEGFLIDNVQMTYAVTQSMPMEHQVFLMWFNMSNPSFLKESSYKLVVENALASGIDPDDFDTISLLLER